MHGGIKFAALMLFIGFCASCVSHPAQPPGGGNSAANSAGNQPTRLTRVDLFSQGLGVFQYQGIVHGTRTQTLTLQSGQINDVLKSLVFQDTGGGRAGEVTFPAATPISVILHGFQVDLSNNPSRRELLAQLRGVAVTFWLMKPARAKITGRIIDVLHRGFYAPPMEPAGPVVRYNGGTGIGAGTAGWYINLLSGSQLKEVQMKNVKSIQIDNLRLRQSLEKTLDALANQPDPHKRPLTIWFQGHGTRLVRFAYLLETPLWRMTYRLILPIPPVATATEPSGAAAQKPVLQGMAIVANQTDMDWDNVRLDIRGGEPLSFIEDLYQPLYMWRPIAPRPDGAYLTPQTYGIGNIPQPYAVKALGGGGNAGGGGGGNLFTGAGAFAARQAGLQDQLAARQNVAYTVNPARLQINNIPFNPLQGVHAMAAAGVVHPAFDYRVKDVTVPQGQSAMVPVLVTPIHAEQLDFITIGQPSTNPFLAVRITNNTHKYLPPGTLTVYTRSIYDGECQFGAMAPGKHHIYTFAVDQFVTVSFKDSRQKTVLRWAQLNGGTLLLKRCTTTNSRYLVNNAASEERTLRFRNALGAKEKVFTASHGLTIRNGYYEGTLKLKPTSTTGLQLNTVVNHRQNIYLANQDHQYLLEVMKIKGLPEKIITAIHRALILLHKAHIRQAALAVTNALIQQTQSDEGRLRENLRAIKKVSPVYNKMAAQLAALDNHLMDLQRQTGIEQHSLDVAQQAVARYWAETAVPKTPAK